MPSRAKKRDRNHAECVAEFRRLGCSVLDLGSVGEGVPDVLVGITYGWAEQVRSGEWRYKESKVNVLAEIKDGEKAKLTVRQSEWHTDWKGQVCIVRNLEDVRNLVKSYRGE